MGLDRGALAAALLEAFGRAEQENWTKKEVADEFAKAIDDFVRGGDVTIELAFDTSEVSGHRHQVTQTVTGSID